MPTPRCACARTTSCSTCAAACRSCAFRTGRTRSGSTARTATSTSSSPRPARTASAWPRSCRASSAACATARCRSRSPSAPAATTRRGRTSRGRRNERLARPAHVRGARRGAGRAGCDARRIRRRGHQQALRRCGRAAGGVPALVSPHPLPVPGVPQRARLQDARRLEQRADGRHRRRQVLRHVPQRRDRLGRGELRALPFGQAWAAKPHLRRPPDFGTGAVVMRLAALVLVLAVLLVGCQSAAPSREPAGYSALVSGQVIRGGFLADQARPGATGQFTQLRGPLAVAAMGPDVFIADSGLGMLLRVDPVANRLTPLGKLALAPGTRLAADIDGSLYVLDPLARRVERRARDGRALQVFVSDPTIASLRDLALDHVRGRLLAVDALNRQLVAFRPLGTSSELLPLYGEPRYQITSLDAIAVAPDALYAIDGRCPCLARLDFDGRVLETFGHERVRKPERLAADRHGRLFVADRGDSSIKVFRGTALEETIPFARLGLLEATDLAYAEPWLYVADAPGVQVRMLRVVAPQKAVL